MVPIVGPIYKEPVPMKPRACLIPDGAILPPIEGGPYEVREYELRTWLDASDMDAPTIGPRYVLREIKL